MNITVTMKLKNHQNNWLQREWNGMWIVMPSVSYSIEVFSWNKQFHQSETLCYMANGLAEQFCHSVFFLQWAQLTKNWHLLPLGSWRRYRWASCLLPLLCGLHLPPRKHGAHQENLSECHGWWPISWSHKRWHSSLECNTWLMKIRKVDIII